MKGKIVAICLAAGQGKRMQSKIQKQYMMLKNKPVVCYSLDAFEKSEVEEVILVVAPGEETYCKKEIVDKYKYAKVKQIVSGGKERYHSVANGLNSITDADYVLIHDGARPMLNQEILQECIEGVKKYKACITAMPVKDTIKISDEDEYIQSTPPRSRIWQIQTPQCFSFSLIKEAYERLIEEEKNSACSLMTII